METVTHRSAEVRESATAGTDYPPLDRETRTAVDTDCAAFHLNREPQTLRVWACKESGPIRPRRINGRLAWPVAELRRVLGVSQWTPRSGEGHGSPQTAALRDHEQAGDDYQAGGIADQAALVVEGESYARAYLERLHAGMAQPDELAAIFAFMSGEMQRGFARVIAKALEGLRHA